PTQPTGNSASRLIGTQTDSLWRRGHVSRTTGGVRRLHPRQAQTGSRRQGGYRRFGGDLRGSPVRRKPPHGDNQGSDGGVVDDPQDQSEPSGSQGASEPLFPRAGVPSRLEIQRHRAPGGGCVAGEAGRPAPP